MNAEAEKRKIIESELQASIDAKTNRIARIRSAMAGKEKSYTQLISELKLKAEQTIDKAKSEYVSQITKIRTYAARQIAKERTRADQLSKIAVKRHAKANARIESASTIKREFKNKISYLKAEANEVINSIRFEAKERQAGLKQVITNLKAEAERTSNIHDREIAAIKAELGLSMVRQRAQAYKVKAKEQIKVQEFGQGQIKDSDKSKQQVKDTMSEREKFAEKLSGYTSIDEFMGATAMTSNKP